MAELQTNFNVAPFYDDYDEDKMYYRVLFRPSTAVQARELTQLQTMMQKQISRFGSSIYKDGSVVEGCNFTQYPALPQVKFKDSNTATLDFKLLTREVTDVANVQSHMSDSYLLVSNNTLLRAAIFEAFSGAEAAVNRGSNDTNRAYVIYINTGRSDASSGGSLTGTGTPVYTFSTAGEKINVYSPLQDKTGALNPNYYVGDIYTLPSNNTVNALGTGFGLHVGQGIIYQKGFFLKSNPKNFMIKEHSTNAVGIKVGFNTKEYIVTPHEDPSLYDNSLGSPNYNAPGAYRLKLVPDLIAYDTTNTDVIIPKDFVPVVDFSGGTGTAVTIQEDPLYSIIGDVMAKRTKEESGDYVVKPFQVNVEPTSNTQTMYYTVSPGVAYVDGYRVEFRSPRRIEVRRGIDSNSSLNERVTVNFGNYMKVADFSGIVDVGGIESVDLYSANQYSLTKNFAGGVNPTGTIVGNATIRAVKYYSGIKGTAQAQYLVYVTNINLVPGNSFQANVKSIGKVSGTFTKIFGDIVPETRTTTGSFNQLYQSDTTQKSLLFYTGLDGTKRLLSSTGANNTSYIYRTTLDAVNATRGSGSFTASFTSGTDEFNYGATAGLDDSLSTDIHVQFAQDTLANCYSTTTISLGSQGGVSNATHSNVTCAAVTAATGSFINNWGSLSYPITTPTTSGIFPKVGDGIKASYKVATVPTVSYHTITAINSANSISITPPLSGVADASSITLQRFFKVGTHVDFNGGGNVISFSTSGSPPKVNQMGITVALDLDTSQTYQIRAQVPLVRNQATPIEKVVTKDAYVAINCASHPASTSGPWSLGIPDVYNIKAIYVGANFANTNPDRKDWFSFDNGQRDNFYGLSYISILPQFKNAISSTSRIFVRLDHFTPNVTSTKATFFSVDSYSIDDANTANTTAVVTAQIPVYKDISGNLYDLRNHIDFRPVMKNTAVSSVSAVFPNYTINPANTSLVYYSSPSVKMAIEPDTNMTYNIEYYLPRVDTLIINKDGLLSVKSSAPSYNSKPPIVNDTGLKIADVYVTPYPSLTFSEAE
jgi:Domain of unknown function (DUF4815)